jgi:hypothetical protein
MRKHFICFALFLLSGIVFYTGTVNANQTCTITWWTNSSSCWMCYGTQLGCLDRGSLPCNEFSGTAPTNENYRTQLAADEAFNHIFQEIPEVYEDQCYERSSEKEGSIFGTEYSHSRACLDGSWNHDRYIEGFIYYYYSGEWNVECCYPSGMTSESWCGQTWDGESFNPDQCCSGICGQTGPEWYEIQCIDGASALGPGACDWESDWAVYNGYTDGNSVCCNGTVVTGNICDPDGDGVNIDTDNCPDNCNAQQLDADGDNIGDVCDSTPGCGGCGEPECEQVCSE